FHTIVSIKNDGHYFCRAGGNRPDGLNEPVTLKFAVNQKSAVERGISAGYRKCKTRACFRKNVSFAEE
ncbi:hypothetical protein, partial [Escherichia coli]|uniref:hypothetical protein n=1 Tax=Escherichia coli TaxID=562 RepID=UPI003F57D891